jgi:hypothetical protein
MSSIHTPQEKKRLAYELDHYAKGKCDKAFRKSWPKKKRKSNRSFRHAADGLTKAAGLDGLSDTKIATIKRRPLRKWGVPSLRERVAHTLEARIRRIGAKKARRAKRK